jgi:VanZ family protein
MRVRLLRRPGLWLPPFLLMGLIFVLSAQPSLDSGLGVLDLIGRKLIHFAVYALLCLLWWRLLRTQTESGKAILLALVLSSLYAASDEFHQSQVEGRNGTAVDWVIDTTGAALVALRLRLHARRETVA